MVLRARDSLDSRPEARGEAVQDPLGRRSFGAPAAVVLLKSHEGSGWVRWLSGPRSIVGTGLPAHGPHLASAVRSSTAALEPTTVGGQHWRPRSPVDRGLGAMIARIFHAMAADWVDYQVPWACEAARRRREPVVAQGTAAAELPDPAGVVWTYRPLQSLP